MKKENELKKEIKSINESIKALGYLRGIVPHISSPLTYHEIPISDNIKGKVIDIIESDLCKQLQEAEKELYYLGESDQNDLSNVVSAILNHLNKASEI